MLNRVTVALAMALIGVFGATAPAFADFDPDKTEVMVGTALIALGLMTLLFVVYLIKWIFGAAGDLPPEAPADPHH